MPSVKCAVDHCQNRFKKTKQKGLKISYHKFPKNEQVLQAWVKACQRDEPWNPYTSTICSIHFREEDFENPLLNIPYAPTKRKLLPTAIPTLFLDCKAFVEKLIIKVDNDAEPTTSARARRAKIYSLQEFENELTIDNQSVENPVGEFEEIYIKTENVDEFQEENLVEPPNKRSKFDTNLDTPDSSDPKDENRLQRIIRLLEEKLAKVISENDQLREQNEKLKKENDELRTTQQSIKNNLDKTFTSGQVKALLNPNIVKKWNTDDIATALILESISPKAYRYLLNVRKMPLPSVPILRKWVARTSFDLDELTPMMRVIRYKRKSFADDTMATVLCLQDINISNTGESCQIVMARGMFKSWSQPVYCAYNTSITKDLLLLIITELYNVGFTVMAVVYDLSLFYIFEEPKYLKQYWIEHPVEKNLRIFAFVDSRYLLNMLRDHFINSEFNINGHIINKNIIKKILQTNSHELNISEKHISNRNLNDTKLAEGLFSSNVADVLSSYDQKDLPYKEAAEMVKTINQWYSLFQRDIDDGFGCNVTPQSVTLYNTNKFIKLLRVDDLKMNDCLKALLRNNKSLLELYTYLEHLHEFNIPTKNLSRDVLENLLSYSSPVEQRLDNQYDFIVKSRFMNYIIGSVFSIGLDSNNSSVTDVSSETKCVEKSDNITETVETDSHSAPYEEITIKTEVEEIEEL